MDPRYTKKKISDVFSMKHELWQETELAALEAKVKLGMISDATFKRIAIILESSPIDLKVIAEIEELLRHDLNAFIEERKKRLPDKVKHFLHEALTSYDTEEPAFARMLKLGAQKVRFALEDLLKLIAEKAQEYRYTIMLARTHGQEAKLQTHGKRLLTWCVQLKLGLGFLSYAEELLAFSKMSGAIGNYGDLSPELEKEALEIMGLKPFYGATQIMPREIYLPIANALTSIVGTINKIALDIRLGSRSGNTIYQESFKKTQMGSSAMPHKKNTISTEQLEGMFRMAKGYQVMITDNIATWEERAIEQSCVERVGWSDLFHVTLHSLETITKVISGMKVFTDNMLREIDNSRGCYASDEAKNFLGKKLVPYGLSKDAYRIIQLAAENAHNPGPDMLRIRNTKAKSFKEAEALLEKTGKEKGLVKSIRGIIGTYSLVVSPDLAANEEQVEKWNNALRELFENPKNREAWNRLFRPSYLLRHEPFLFQKILGI